jgi:hypothetical protein
MAEKNQYLNRDSWRLSCFCCRSLQFFSVCSGRHRSCRPRARWGTCSARARGAFDLTNVLLGTSQTDRQGRYVKKDLAPGSYILKVSRVAFEPEVATVSVTSKKTTDLELILISRSRAQASTRAQAASTFPAHRDAIRSALEETGASWIKNFGKSEK